MATIAFGELRSQLLRHLLHRQNQFLLRVISTTIAHPLQQITPSSASLPPSPPASSVFFHFPRTLSSFAFPSSTHTLHHRNFASDSSDLPPNVVLIKSGKELEDLYKKAQDESLSAIFYFTAEWCGPCRFLWPDMRKLSEELDHVKFCKVDIDLESVGDFLARLNISSVPTLFFFSDGKKAAEVIGADSKKIRNIAAELYSSGLVNLTSKYQTSAGMEAL